MNFIFLRVIEVWTQWARAKLVTPSRVMEVWTQWFPCKVNMTPLSLHMPIAFILPWPSEKWNLFLKYPPHLRSISVAEWLALPTSDHGVAGSNPAGGEILPEPKRHFIAESLSCSPFHRLEMTEILLKGRKTLTHPSILLICSTDSG